VELRRGGESVIRVMYTIDDAIRSGQTAKGGPWKQYPRDMCAWAAVKRACRLGAPDLVNAIPGIDAGEAADLLEESGELPPPITEFTPAGGDRRSAGAERAQDDAEDAGEMRHDPEAEEDLEAAYAEAEAREEARQAEMLK